LVEIAALVCTGGPTGSPEELVEEDDEELELLVVLELEELLDVLELLELEDVVELELELEEDDSPGVLPPQAAKMVKHKTAALLRISTEGRENMLFI
jgi:hypothetical protein